MIQQEGKRIRTIWLLILDGFISIFDGTQEMPPKSHVALKILERLKWSENSPVNFIDTIL
jgi:hypothetical protein